MLCCLQRARGGVVITLAEWMIHWWCALGGIRPKEPEFLIQNYTLTDIGYHVLWSGGIGSRVWFTRKCVIGWSCSGLLSDVGLTRLSKWVLIWKTEAIVEQAIVQPVRRGNTMMGRSLVFENAKSKTTLLLLGRSSSIGVFQGSVPSLWTTWF